MFDREVRKAPRPPREHGDWKRPSAHPEDAVHLVNPPVSEWKRKDLRVEYLQSHGYSEEDTDEEEPPVVPISGFPRFLRLFIALFLLLPLSIIMVLALMQQLYHAAPTVSSSGFWLSEPVWFSLLGAGTFVSVMIMRLLEPVLVYIYVLGHELTHALAALLCFGRVQSFRIGFGGGFIETDTDNLFIALAPYFVPLWMLVWMLGFWLGNLMVPFDAYLPLFYSGFGFWWSFHLYWTVWVIPREQPDMLENGMLLSMLVIILMNIVVLLIVLCCFDVITPSGYAADLVSSAEHIGNTLKDCFVLLRRVLH